MSCEYWFAYPCDDPRCVVQGYSRIDNEDRVFDLTTEILPGGPPNLKRWKITLFDGTATTVLAYTDERVRPDGQIDSLTNVPENFLFYPNSGKLQLGRLSSVCLFTPPEFCVDDYGSVPWVPVFTGFATLYEILQTFETSSGPVSFRVPYMPEGFQFADWFDTYYGDLATVGDWSQAQPLKCGYPAAAPVTGDDLTVDDVLPDPPPGTGRYYVTAVTYQGERRFGRESETGVLHGRDPVTLPECQ